MANMNDKIGAKIRALSMKTTDAGCTEEEALSAAAMIQKLLAEYNLEMSQVVAGDQEVTPDATRDVFSCVMEASTEWQSELLNCVTANNFCYGYRKHGQARVYNMIGRSVNVQATVQVYTYLVAAVDRLCPFRDKRSMKSINSWKEGCSDRLRDRLYRQRQDAEAASRAERGEGPRGNGADLVLSDVYSSEDDLNRDFKRGCAPGTTARERMEWEARWAADAEARRNAPAVVVVERPMTAAERKRLRSAILRPMRWAGMRDRRSA